MSLSLAIALFLLAGCGVIFSYAIYPLLLLLVPRSRVLESQAPSTPDEWPSMSMVITAYNEAGRIRRKLDNALSLAYPGALEIVVASDCSDDGTDEIVAEYADRGVRLVRATARLGKENAQETAIRTVTADVVVFSDVATEMQPDALERLARWFGDPRIGAVSSEDRFIASDGGVAGEGAYVRYEMWLRRLESERAGLVGLSGSFFAARLGVCQRNWHAPSDFSTALNCARMGLVAISAPDVLGYYQDLQDPSREYQRKVRTVLRGITGLFQQPGVMAPTMGIFALQVWCHKIMRWLVPWFLLATLAMNVVLAGMHPLFLLLLGAHLGVYSLVLLGHLMPNLQALGPIRLVYFFVQVNIAIAHATVLWASGQRMAVWQPSARPDAPAMDNGSTGERPPKEG